MSRHSAPAPTNSRTRYLLAAIVTAALAVVGFAGVQLTPSSADAAVTQSSLDPLQLEIRLVDSTGAALGAA